MSGLALLRRPAVGPLLGAQLFTALGDNALLIVAIALLEQSGAAEWMSPALRICLYLSYVVRAPFAAVLADGMPKVLLIVLVNLAKLGGCILLAARIHPLVASGAIGLAGVCYGPAKYGILAELVSEADLVLANAWIEVATVSAILGGAALGAALLTAPLRATSLHASTPGEPAAGILVCNRGTVRHRHSGHRLQQRPRRQVCSAIRTTAGRHGPADHLTRVQIEHGQIQPSGASTDVGDIADVS